MARAKRHPVRGVLAGLLTGIGAALLLVVFSVIALGTLTPYLCIVAGALAGVVWSVFGPTRRRRRGSTSVAATDTQTNSKTKTEKVKNGRKDKAREPTPLAWTAPSEPEDERDPPATGEATS